MYTGHLSGSCWGLQRDVYAYLQTSAIKNHGATEVSHSLSLPFWLGEKMQTTFFSVPRLQG